MSVPVPTDTSADDQVLRLLADSDLEIEGRLVDASNVALRVWVGEGEKRTAAVYKPIRGERPLWDFPDGSLAGRELAASYVSDATGWNFVPRTVLRDGPLGPGTVQQWVGPLEGREDPDFVRIDAPADVPDGNVPVLAVRDEADRPLVVSHSDTPRLRTLAVFDALLNNADRKASALLADDATFWAIDHGLCFHEEQKLRTVFWGFAGEPIAATDIAALQRFSEALDGGLVAQLEPLLTLSEIEALHERLHGLLADGVMPEVPEDRHPLPWPLW